MTIDVLEVNALLVKIFNDVLTIEESELQKSNYSDISIKEMHIIDAIGLHQNKTTTEVAKVVMVTVGTMTVAINNLVKKGYVERIRSNFDRRVVNLGLTHKGKIVYRIHQTFHKKMVRNILKDMEDVEGETLIKALCNLENYLERLK
ncbi:MAG: MarR family transcriptional regulator [Streptococcaceae bacterium]|nr:MarR family transcriptional regulator [Streptococcaceae bacterium]